MRAACLLLVLVATGCNGSPLIGGPCEYHEEEEVTLLIHEVGDRYVLGRVTGPPDARLMHQIRNPEAVFEAARHPDLAVAPGQQARALSRSIRQGSCVPVMMTLIRSEDAHWTLPIEAPEPFIREYILRVQDPVLFEDEPEAVARLRAMTPAGLRLVRNAIFARQGYVFDSPELRRFFEPVPFEDWDWYEPSDAPLDISPAEAGNVRFIQSLEAAHPKPSVLETLFSTHVHELTRLTGPGYDSHLPVIPAELVRAQLGDSSYPHELYYKTYIPAYRSGSDELGDLLLYVERTVVGDDWFALLLKEGRPVGAPVDLRFSDADSEVGDDQPVVRDASIYLSPYNIVFIVELVVPPQARDEAAGNPVELQARVFGLDKDWHFAEVTPQDYALRTLLDLLYERMEQAVGHMTVGEVPYASDMAVQNLLAKALWILEHDVTVEGVESHLRSVMAVHEPVVRRNLQSFDDRSRAVLETALSEL
jgi:hypothetical protein